MRKETERSVGELDVARLICNLSLTCFFKTCPVEFFSVCQSCGLLSCTPTSNHSTLLTLVLKCLFFKVILDVKTVWPYINEW